MHRVVVACAAVLALAACSKKAGETAATGDGAPAAANAPAGPITPPKRKPGLWVQTISTTGMSQETKLCLDEATEARLTLWGQAAGQNACARNQITPVAGGWKVDAECDLGDAGKSVTSGTITGDFNSRYVMKMTSTTTGSKIAQANVTQEMEVTGAWQGACPADMKPGDMLLPGGMKMNLNQITAMQGKAAGK
jgi:hypothetical protein